MQSLIPSIVVLGSALILAAYLASSREYVEDAKAVQRLVTALVLATALQFIHFIEETFTGFHAQFPALLGLPAMPFGLFIGFNLVWIAIWIVSALGISRRVPMALIPAWFLAIAGTLNGLAHPGMALVAGSYFPGLISSPVVGLACVYLWVVLLRTTRGLTPP